MKKNITNLLLASIIALFTGCSNLDVGFEKNSVFHSDAQEEKFANAVVNVYLDKSTNNKDKFRLIINGEDTELNLYYDAITRFGINKKSATISLLKNNVKVVSIDLTLENYKNYYLSVTQNSDTELSTIQIIDKSQINPKTKATALFISEEVVKEEELKSLTKKKEILKQEKISVAEKQKIGVDKYSKKIETVKKEKKPAPSIKKERESTLSVEEEKKEPTPSVQEAYEKGEAIFYYDSNDGE